MMWIETCGVGRRYFCECWRYEDEGSLGGKRANSIGIGLQRGRCEEVDDEVEIIGRFGKRGNRIGR
jgi:hypothetical protein